MTIETAVPARPHQCDHPMHAGPIYFHHHAVISISLNELIIVSVHVYTPVADVLLLCQSATADMNHSIGIWPPVQVDRWGRKTWRGWIICPSIFFDPRQWISTLQKFSTLLLSISTPGKKNLPYFYPLRLQCRWTLNLTDDRRTSDDEAFS